MAFLHNILVQVRRYNCVVGLPQVGPRFIVGPTEFHRIWFIPR